MNQFFAFFAFILISLACGTPTPTIDHRQPIDTLASFHEVTTDSTKKIFAELPVRFDSTNVLLHAIRVENLRLKEGYMSKSTSYSSGSPSTSFFSSEDRLYGPLVNVVFELADGSRKQLTDRKMTIQQITFLRELYNHSKQQVLLYEVYETDTNGDGQVNANDLRSLYLSQIDGSTFERLSNPQHHLHDYQLLKNDSTLYFRTLEDTNKDGQLNNQDQFHYHKVIFTDAGYRSTNYDPIEILK